MSITKELRVSGDGISVSQLLGSSYSDVARAFEDFQTATLGGYPKNVKPRMSFGVPGYHVESSFDDEQSQYAGAAMVTISRMIDGRQDLGNGETSQRLSDRIVNRYFSNPNNYLESVTNSVIDTIAQFDQRWSNMRPALNAVFQIAGKEGLELALTVSSIHLFALKDAVRAAEFEDLMKIYRAIHFTNTHPRGVPANMKEYEVWCTGRNVAEAIMRESAHGAQRLAEIPGVLENYVPSNDSLPYNFTEQLSRRVRKFAAQIRRSVEDVE